MKKAVVSAYIILFIFFSVNVEANGSPIVKGSFSGIITDVVSGQPIAGVSVYISDLKIGTYTNQKGEFSIPQVSEGVHLIEISHIGYTTIADNVIIAGDVIKNYSLDEAIVENDAVIVTGVTKATQLKKMPFQVSVIRKEELLQNATTNIVDALTKKAGVYNLSTGPAISKPLVRGLGYNRVLTINDGVRQEGQQWGDEHGLEIDESSVSKVEIFKGPASLIYGSDAMAGVINIITNVPVPLNTLVLNAGSIYQSNNNLIGFNANVAGNVKGFNWNAYVSSKAANDYRNKYDGYVFNSKFNEGNFGGYAGYNGNWGFTHLLFSQYNLTAGLVEGERDDEGFFIKETAIGSVRATNKDFKTHDPSVPFQDIKHTKLALDNSFKTGQHRLALNLGWQRNERKEFGNVNDPNERSLYFDLSTFTYTTALQFKQFKGWKPSIGVNGMQQNNKNRGVEQLIPDYALFDAGGYLFAEKELKGVVFSGGARFDTRKISTENLLEGTDVKTPAFSRSFKNFSGSLGLTAPVSKTVNLKFNIARAFRAPGIAELASNGAHEGTNRYEYGQKNLSSEISYQYDAAVEFSNKHFSVNLAGYYNSFRNFIFYSKLGNSAGGDSILTIDGEEFFAFRFNQRKAALAGIELSVDIHPHPLDWLHIQNTFSIVSGKFAVPVDGSKYLPFIPAPKLLTEFRGNFKTVSKSLANVFVKFEIDNSFRQQRPFTAYETETATKAYTLLNAGLGSDIVNSKGRTLFSINFQVTNLADVAYQNHLSRLKYAAENMVTGRRGVFGMGRNFSVKLNVPFKTTLNK